MLKHECDYNVGGAGGGGGGRRISSPRSLTLVPGFRQKKF